MKKTFLTLLFAAILSTLSLAQTVQKTYYFETPTFSKVNGYDVMKFADTYNNGIAGEASLPCKTVSLLLPQNTYAQSITVEYNDFVELEGTYNILPQQKARPLSSTEPLVFEKNDDFYRSEDVYPKTTFSKVNTHYLNGCSFAFAQFSPVRYVPATGKVSYAQSVTVTVDVTASKSDRNSLLWLTPEVQGRVERLAQNPEAVKEYKSRAKSITGYELLVITPESYVPHFDEYVAFYEARGLRTHVTALETILASFDGRDDAEKVRNYIIQEYENQGIMMVLLGGDANVVPWRALYCFPQEGTPADFLPADMYFSCLDGTWDDDDNGIWGEIGEDDLLPEIAVGRMTFNNMTQFNNIMHKTLEYQANPVLGEFRTVVLGAEHLGDGYYGSTDLDRLIGGSDDYDYTTVGVPEDYNFVKFYESPAMTWNGGLFRNTINDNGGQYVHHVGHANTTYVAGWDLQFMDDNSFAQLNGVDHNYGFFHSHGCVCGDFSHSCILEKMVTISTGFVVTTGNSRYGWYMPWGDGMAAHLHREFVDAYYNDRLPYIGTAFTEMKIMTAPYVNTPYGDEGCMRWNIYDLNIMGDVAVCPWLDEPFRPEVSYASALTPGTTTMPVSITKNGVPQSNFRCSIFHDGDLLAFGMTDENGNADINFAEALDVVDTLQLIITGPNAWPQTLTVIGLNANEAFVYPQNIDIHGDYETGRAINMDVDFTNAGTVGTNTVIATLTSTSEYVTMSKSTAIVGSIGAGQTVSVTDAFDVTVDSSIPDGTITDFVVTCVDGTNVWNRDIFFLAKAPNLIINELSYEELDGDMNGYMDPGETVRVTIAGTNKGHFVAPNPRIHAELDNDFIIIINNDFVFDDIEAGDSFVEYIDLQISPDTPNETVVDLNMSVISGQYSGDEDLTFCVGTVSETFESGDLTAHPWQLWGDAEWFVTDSISHSGNYCAQCGHITKNQKTSMIIELDVIVDGTISFYVKTLTKYKKDYLIFYLDGKVKKYWTGDTDWTFVSFDISEGYHILEWRYDTSKSGGTDGNVCWVDDIMFPANSIIKDDVEEIMIEDNVALYPNPAKDVIYLQGEDIQYVAIYNAIGMQVMSQKVSDSESINIADLANGMYFVRIIDEKGNILTKKFIKE